MFGGVGQGPSGRTRLATRTFCRAGRSEMPVAELLTEVDVSASACRPVDHLWTLLPPCRRSRRTATGSRCRYWHCRNWANCRRCAVIVATWPVSSAAPPSRVGAGIGCLFCTILRYRRAASVPGLLRAVGRGVGSVTKPLATQAAESAAAGSGSRAGSLGVAGRGAAGSLERGGLRRYGAARRGVGWVVGFWLGIARLRQPTAAGTAAASSHLAGRRLASFHWCRRRHCRHHHLRLSPLVYRWFPSLRRPWLRRVRPGHLDCRRGFRAPTDRPPALRPPGPTQSPRVCQAPGRWHRRLPPRRQAQSHRQQRPHRRSCRPGPPPLIPPGGARPLDPPHPFRLAP